MAEVVDQKHHVFMVSENPLSSGQSNEGLKTFSKLMDFDSPDTSTFKLKIPKSKRIKTSAVSGPKSCVITDEHKKKAASGKILRTLSNIGNGIHKTEPGKGCEGVGSGEAAQEFDSLDFPHCEELFKVFKEKFGLSEFRINQLAAINAALLGNDCFILMPTGGGKSLCYQLPALLSSGITVVVSPLRSLIVDQTQKLLSLDIPARYLTGDLTEKQVAEVYLHLNKYEPELRLLYVTPEKLSQSNKLLKSLAFLHSNKKLTRFVIDEAHCVSQWGHDFRPDYKKLNVLRERFPDVPIMALTATATQKVRSDVALQLLLDSSKVKWFVSGFNRSNLIYEILPKKSDDSRQQIVEIILERFKDECGIVYCPSQKECDDHASTLRTNGISAVNYHAGLTDKKRITMQTQWITGKVKVICATIAFGMGIDKANVRFVLHAALPTSLEGYYQESGRAGRDGDPAHCILLYKYDDVYRRFRLLKYKSNYTEETFQNDLDNLNRVVSYCDNLADCRRALQLSYFGEDFNRQSCIDNTETSCDNCRFIDRTVEMDVTDDAKAIVQMVQELDEFHTNSVSIFNMVNMYKGCEVLLDKKEEGCNYHRWFGRGKLMDKKDIERLIHKLVIEGYLVEHMQEVNGVVRAYIVPGKLADDLLKKDGVQILLHKRERSVGDVDVSESDDENIDGAMKILNEPRKRKKPIHNGGRLKKFRGNKHQSFRGRRRQ
ncbi:hypothetical protein QAD02_006231 [Eretmocerus hayati]|uniref:Uncharacterized protein n=1 Tax=Eretmocerus hayati TaxID=131215 RepID=A0ACC2N0D8_9HYME|nr:hypothetical protein QAD02_006231 [Eretmocerus hayati]